MSSRVWKGNADLVPLLVPLRELDEDPKNVRIHSPTSIEAIRTSFTTFGQTKNAVGWRSHPGARIIALCGNGTLRALREAGWTHLAVSVFEGSEVKARALAIADNAVPLFAEWDEPAKTAQLEWIQAEFDVGAGWTSDAALPDFAVATEAPTPEPSKPTRAEPATPAEPKASRGLECPTCGRALQ